MISFVDTVDLRAPRVEVERRVVKRLGFQTVSAFSNAERFCSTSRSQEAKSFVDGPEVASRARMNAPKDEHLELVRANPTALHSRLQRVAKVLALGSLGAAR